MMKDLCIETYPEPTFRRWAGGDSSDLALFFGARKPAAALAEITALARAVTSTTVASVST
ncbi:hypothetical protein [Micromonospora sp. DT41]|uniref:hypothetical protein n=1 Tax=Micromonospora sp. DT41 TaxID=3393437 RepID=UPI003CF6BF45